MAYNRITWVPAVLRAAGLKVVEHSGWKERGLSTAQRFEPKHIVWHHDASAKGDSPGVPAYMIRNFNSAGAQLWVDRKGVWHIIASGRAAHAGTTLPGKPTNHDSIGIETDHTTGEAWPPELLSSLRKGTAAMLNHMGRNAATSLHFHKSICSPKGRKVDPDGLTLTGSRTKVAAHALALKTKPKPKATKPAPKPKPKTPNHVMKGHAHAKLMLAEFRSTPKTRTRVRELADELDAILKKMPKD